MILGIAVAIIILSLILFSVGIYLELKRHIKEMRREILWTKKQFGLVNEAITRMIKLLWPEPKEDKRNLN